MYEDGRHVHPLTSCEARPQIHTPTPTPTPRPATRLETCRNIQEWTKASEQCDGCWTVAESNYSEVLVLFFRGVDKLIWLKEQNNFEASLLITVSCKLHVLPLPQMLATDQTCLNKATTTQCHIYIIREQYQHQSDGRVCVFSERSTVFTCPIARCNGGSGLGSA